jgi:hypothetical protein
VNAAECPIVTVGTATMVSRSGSTSEPPFAGSRVQLVNPSWPAQAAIIASPRMTAVSWHAWPAGSKRRKLASPGSSSGISTISIPGHASPEALL